MNVLDVQNLTLSFGENTLFSDLSFDIQDKEKVGFVGVNGAGKTSLFKIITGEYKADSGNCLFLKMQGSAIWNSIPAQMIKQFGRNLLVYMTI